MSVTADAARQPRLPIGLAAYGFGYSCGFSGAGTERACTQPMDAYALVDLAVRHGLGGVELPPQHLLPTLEPAELARLRAYVEERSLFIVTDSGVVDVETLRTLLPIAAALGARTLRA